MSDSKIIDGKAFAAGLRQTIARQVATLVSQHKVKPGLAVVLVGENPASQVYVRSKGKQTVEAGMNSFEHKLPAETSQKRTAGAGRPTQSRSGRERHPCAAAAAEADRRAGGDQRHRSRQGRRRLPCRQCRPACDRRRRSGALHAARLPAAAEEPARIAGRQTRDRGRPLKHRRQADGTIADPRELHCYGRPFAHARSAGRMPARRYRGRGRRQARDGPRRLDHAGRRRHRRRHQPRRRPGRQEPPGRRRRLRRGIPPCAVRSRRCRAVSDR